MGNRTVVVLYNDQASEWEKDADLGRKIGIGMNHVYMTGKSDPRADLGYGRVVECSHADTHTLALLEGYRFNPVAFGFWQRNERFEDIQEKMLRAWADRLGYRLVKKAEKKQ